MVFSAPMRRMMAQPMSKARQIEQSGQTTVRIGTSLLYKCRLLPDIWTKINGQFPDLKIEILPLPETRENDAGDAVLGVRYDIREGVYCTIAQKDSCGFLELMRTPFCCAVAKGHRLAGMRKLTLEDLNGEYLVMLYEANGYAIAWLDYYLKGVKENRTAFFGDETEISSNVRYQDFCSEEAAK